MAQSEDRFRLCANGMAIGAKPLPHCKTAIPPYLLTPPKQASIVTNIFLTQAFRTEE